MKNIDIDNHRFELIKNDNQSFKKDDFLERCTEYFFEFDYIFGDYSYDKLRLKGFYDQKNKKCRNINDISKLEDYIENYCSYGAKWFLLKKIK